MAARFVGMSFVTTARRDKQQPGTEVLPGQLALV